MTQTKSHGLMGLPHYNNSRISTDLWEPLYKNLFVVQIQLPESLGLSEEDTNIILEGVQGISGLSTNKLPGVTEQKYKFATRSFAGSKPNNTTVDLTIPLTFNLNYPEPNQPSMQQIKALRAWTDLVWDPLTGSMGLKRDYSASTVTVTMHDRVGNPYWGWIFYNAFPNGEVLGDPNLSYESNELYTASLKLRSDVWDEVMI